MLWVVASGGSHKLRRSGSPPRGVAAARCACGAHPGVLLAASTPNRLRSTRHLRPDGSRGPATSTLHSASRPPPERLRRWAQRPAILMDCNSLRIWLRPSGSRGPAGSLYPPTRQSRAGGATPLRRPQSLASLGCVRAGAAPAKTARPPAPAYDPTDNAPRSPTL